MTCPWLEEKDGKRYCTVLTPSVELSFEKPPEPNVNGATCLMMPRIGVAEPWSECNWYKPK